MSVREKLEHSQRARSEPRWSNLRHFVHSGMRVSTYSLAHKLLQKKKITQRFSIPSCQYVSNANKFELNSKKHSFQIAQQQHQMPIAHSLTNNFPITHTFQPRLQKIIAQPTDHFRQHTLHRFKALIKRYNPM